MKIDQIVKDFLKANSGLINEFKFTSFYELASKKGFYDSSISQMTYLFYRIKVDPLEYMDFVPRAFAYGLNLPNPVVNIPDRIESIHAYAFADTNAVKVIAPANLKNKDLTYHGAAFSNCEDLVEADFSKCDLYEEIDVALFTHCTNLKVIKFPKNLRIIQTEAFYKCMSLTSIDLSDCHKLTEIATGAFAQCYNLTSIYLPNSIEHIGSSAFNTGNPITIIFDGSQQE